MPLLAGENEVTSTLMCAQRCFRLQVISSRVRTSCTETEVIKVTASPVSLSLPLSHWRSASSSTLQASSPLAPLAAHFTPPLLLREERGGRGQRGGERRGGGGGRKGGPPGAERGGAEGRDGGRKGRGGGGKGRGVSLPL